MPNKDGTKPGRTPDSTTVNRPSATRTRVIFAHTITGYQLTLQTSQVHSSGNTTSNAKKAVLIRKLATGPGLTFLTCLNRARKER